MERQRPK
jgi:hypothetical protein